jgi:hypothetical protein
LLLHRKKDTQEKRQRSSKARMLKARSTKEKEGRKKIEGPADT